MQFALAYHAFYSWIQHVALDSLPTCLVSMCCVPISCILKSSFLVTFFDTWFTLTWYRSGVVGVFFKFIWILFILCLFSKSLSLGRALWPRGVSRSFKKVFIQRAPGRNWPFQLKEYSRKRRLWNSLQGVLKWWVCCGC